MKSKKIYIAGKITGDPGYEAKFRRAEDYLMVWLEWDYWDIVNPVEQCDNRWPWWRCMARCLRLVAGCGWVAMLPDWRESRGARIEHKWARILCKKIIYINILNRD